MRTETETNVLCRWVIVVFAVGSVGYWLSFVGVTLLSFSVDPPPEFTWPDLPLYEKVHLLFLLSAAWYNVYFAFLFQTALSATILFYWVELDSAYRPRPVNLSAAAALLIVGSLFLFAIQKRGQIDWDWLQYVYLPTIIGTFVVGMFFVPWLASRWRIRQTDISIRVLLHRVVSWYSCVFVGAAVLWGASRFLPPNEFGSLAEPVSLLTYALRLSPTPWWIILPAIVAVVLPACLISLLYPWSAVSELRCVSVLASSMLAGVLLFDVLTSAQQQSFPWPTVVLVTLIAAAVLLGDRLCKSLVSVRRRYHLGG